MTDEIKLKACPFCGGEAEIIQEAAYKAAHCKNRDCELFYTHIPLGISLIGKDWQSRPLEDKLTAENAKLRAEANMFGNAIQNAISEYYQEGDAEHMAQILENALIDDELANSALMSKVKEGGYAE